MGVLLWLPGSAASSQRLRDPVLTGGLWCGYWDADTEACQEFALAQPADQDYALTMAWKTLRLLTSGMVGSCAGTIRPCVAKPCGSCVDLFLSPHVRAGDWVNAGCARAASCSCDPLSEVVLPGLVADVLSVSIDGAVLVDGADYRLDGNRLLRLGDELWPSCQDMRAGPDDPGSFIVEYVPGVRQDAASARAAGVLACEYAKASSTGKCRLPSSVTTLSRQGVTMDLDNGLFSNGLTGIREVDVFILSVNPNRLRNTPRVWSPDAPSHRVVGV